MKFECGNILKVSYPFSDFSNSKPRPLIIISINPSDSDLKILPITTQDHHSFLIKIEPSNVGKVVGGLENIKLINDSFVKCDKVMTINKSVFIDGNAELITTAKSDFVEKLQEHARAHIDCS